MQYQYSAGNYLSARGAANYAWGPYGQLISKTEGAVTTEYGCNAQRLMNAVKVGGAAAANYEYDALGRRVKAVEGGTTIVTLHSGNDIVHEIMLRRAVDPPLEPPPPETWIIIDDPVGPITMDPAPAPQGSGITVTSYLALNGKYLAKIVRENANPAQTFFLHTDMVDSVRAITDSAGEVVARLEYEPFGLLTTSTCPMAAGAHRFTGKPEDGATELYYFGARYYGPEVGRFISRDPVCYGLNWYSYCSLSPAVAGPLCIAYRISDIICTPETRRCRPCQ
ncbi:MAG: RHS repeat-associated core domain-containing protein [Firmicutes bacterium]|nr:RHS repeat-associated core domain-containing protein [Bacillota bacterium]